MKRRYGFLALAVLALLLLNLGGQDDPDQPVPASRPSPVTAASSPQASAPRLPAAGQTAAASGPVTTEPLHASWRAMPDEMSHQLASEITDSDQPLSERLANLEAMETGWMSEGESLFRLQGRYAQALEQLAQENEQLPLAERLAVFEASQPLLFGRLPVGVGVCVSCCAPFANPSV